MASVLANARINEPWSIRTVIQRAFGTEQPVADHSCFSFRTSFQDEKRNDYFTCLPSGLVTGLQLRAQCDPIQVVGTGAHRDLPFTDSRFYFLVYVAGRSAEQVQGALQSARALRAGDYVDRYTLNGRMDEAYFHSALDPAISGIDCEGYSLTRLEYPAATGPRILAR